MAFNFFKRVKGSKKTQGDKGLQNKHYYQLRVKEIVRETKDTISIIFEMPDPKIAYKPGQFLTIIADINGKEIRRSYSFCSAPGIDEDIAVTVKRVESGMMSNYLADNLRLGQTLKVMEPMGRFVVDNTNINPSHLVMFAGGSGITPMMSIIKSILHAPATGTKISLIYANREAGSIIFRNELEVLASNYPDQFNLMLILDNSDQNWTGYTGLLNDQMLEEIFDHIGEIGLPETKYLICGPEGMMVNVEHLLSRRSVDKKDILKESFATSSTKHDQDNQVVQGETKTVKINYAGKSYKIAVKPGDSILETALDQNIDLPFSCQAGLCTACRGKLVSGKVKLDEEEGLTPEEREQGYVLTCVGHPLSDDVEINIG